MTTIPQFERDPPDHHFFRDRLRILGSLDQVNKLHWQKVLPLGERGLHFQNAFHIRPRMQEKPDGAGLFPGPRVD